MECFIPKLRRIEDALKEMHEEDAFCALRRNLLEQLIWNNKITAKKYGDAWLINIDELYGYFQTKPIKTNKKPLPLKVNMQTSGQIYGQFRISDEETMIRRQNLRRFCAANNIHTAINYENQLYLYDFNEFLMTVNPKRIAEHIEMPILRRFERAVNDLRIDHYDIARKITWKLAFELIETGHFFRERYGKGWILNYKEFEEEVMKALDE